MNDTTPAPAQTTNRQTAGRAVWVLWNPGAGAASKPELAPVVEEVLGAEGRLLAISGPEETGEALAEADRAGAVVAIAGGDGTVHAIVNACRRAEVRPTLAVVPMGTANNFARSLAIPDDPAAALRLARDSVRDGEFRPLDLIRIESDGFDSPVWAATNVTIGNADRVIERLNDEEKDRWGAWCYLRAALPVIADLESLDLTIRYADQTLRRGTWNLIIANCRIAAGGLEVSPDAAIDDGLLDSIWIQEGAGLDLVALAAQLLAGDYRQHDRVDFRRVERMEIEAKQPFSFLADGEQLTAKRLAISAEWHAMEVLK